MDVGIAVMLMIVGFGTLLLMGAGVVIAVAAWIIKKGIDA